MSSKRPVVLYGASGFSGRLTAEYLREYNVPFIAAGAVKGTGCPPTYIPDWRNNRISKICSLPAKIREETNALARRLAFAWTKNLGK